MSDLEHIQRVLSAPTRSQSTDCASNQTSSDVQAQRRHSGRKSARSKQSSLSHTFQAAQPLPEQRGFSRASQPMTVPDSRSTARAWYCQACDAWVGRDRAEAGLAPHLQSTWMTHTAGIRHRRNVLSSRHFAGAGVSVVSTFETHRGVSCAAGDWHAVERRLWCMGIVQLT